jgi:hypothetical protein
VAPALRASGWVHGESTEGTVQLRHNLPMDGRGWARDEPSAVDDTRVPPTPSFESGHGKASAAFGATPKAALGTWWRLGSKGEALTRVGARGACRRRRQGCTGRPAVQPCLTPRVGPRGASASRPRAHRQPHLVLPRVPGDLPSGQRAAGEQRSCGGAGAARCLVWSPRRRNPHRWSRNRWGSAGELRPTGSRGDRRVAVGDSARSAPLIEWDCRPVSERQSGTAACRPRAGLDR